MNNVELVMNEDTIANTEPVPADKKKSETFIMLSMLFGLMFVQSFVAPDSGSS